MKAFVCSLVVLLALLSACGTPAGPATGGSGAANDQPASGNAAQPAQLTVFAAASLTDAFQEIGKTFEAQHPGAKLTFNFASAPQLVQQITQGAAVDVFASANTRSMEQVVQSGEVVSETVQIFAQNRLVVIYPKDNPAQLQALTDLTKPGLRLTIAAKEVPVGQYALDFLDKAGQNGAYGPSYKDGVIKNVASYEQTVRAVLSKVTLGEADAGIVYRSDLTGANDKVGIIDIPDNLNVIAKYPIAVVKEAQQPQLAQQFTDFVLSAEGQTILSKYGFISIKS